MLDRQYHNALRHRMDIQDKGDAYTGNAFVGQKIVRHPPNLHGLDFIVGDLHGCVEHLHVLMQHVGFDASADRLFSVGDLADRGPGNAATLDLFGAPWFFPVMGNHDGMLLAVLLRHHGLLNELSPVDQLRANIYANAFLGNGGQWLTRYLQDEMYASTLEN